MTNAEIEKTRRAQKAARRYLLEDVLSAALDRVRAGGDLTPIAESSLIAREPVEIDVSVQAVLGAFGGTYRVTVRRDP